MISIAWIDKARHIFTAAEIMLLQGLRSLEVKEKRFILNTSSSTNAMLALILQPQLNIEPLVYNIMASRQITSTERQHLRSALLKDSLSEAEHTLIDRLLYGVRHGLLKTKD